LNKLKELQAKLQKAVETMKAMKVAVADATEKEVEADIEIAQKAYDTAHAEVKSISDELTEAIKEAEEQKNVDLLLAKAADFKKVVIPDEAALAGKKVDDVKVFDNTSQEKHEHLQGEAFFNFMKNGERNMKDQELNILTPKSAAIRDIGNKQGGGFQAVIPHSLLRRMLPGMPFGGKALPMASTDNDAAGGRANLVWPDYGNQILQLPFDEPSLYMRVNKKTTVGGSLVETKLEQDDSNEFGGIAVEWTDEKSDAPDTEIDFERVTINCYPLKAYTSFTKTLLMRSRLPFENELVSKLRAALIAKFDQAIMSGSGVAQPLGITVMAGIRTVGRQTNLQVVYDDLINLEHEVKAAHRNGAGFIMADLVLKYLKKQKDTNGDPLFSNSVGSGPYDRLDNHPYFISHNCSALGTVGDIIFGNLMNYWFVLEEEVAIARSEHAEFKKGAIAYRVDGLAGGQPMFERAFSILVGQGS